MLHRIWVAEMALWLFHSDSKEKTTTKVENINGKSKLVRDGSPLLLLIL